jgi:hypothetical protein
VELNGQELVGYVASALVVASLAMTSVVRLRTISLFGSVTFVAYGVLIESIPIMVTNAAIAVLNTWFLSRELGGRRDLGAVVVPPDSPFLLDFLTHHASDIATFQPDYDLGDPFDFALVLTRDGLPAGVVLGNRDSDQLDIDLDYVLKAYRDSRLGSWLYGRGSAVFRSAGITQLSSAAGRESHPGYLVRMGFRYDPEHDRFTRPV